MKAKIISNKNNRRNYVRRMNDIMKSLNETLYIVQNNLAPNHYKGKKINKSRGRNG